MTTGQRATLVVQLFTRDAAREQRLINRTALRCGHQIDEGLGMGKQTRSRGPWEWAIKSD